MKKIKIRDKEYNCSNRVYYHIQGLESENRVISMELLGHENNELQQQKEIERLNSILDTLEQDMALLNATGIKEIKPKYVFDRIAMLREGVDKE